MNSLINNVLNALYCQLTKEKSMKRFCYTCSLQYWIRHTKRPHCAKFTNHVIGGKTDDKKAIKVVPEQEGAKMKQRAERFNIVNPLDPEKLKQYVLILLYFTILLHC